MEADFVDECIQLGGFESKDGFEVEALIEVSCIYTRRSKMDIPLACSPACRASQVQ